MSSTQRRRRSEPEPEGREGHSEQREQQVYKGRSLRKESKPIACNFLSSSFTYITPFNPQGGLEWSPLIKMRTMRPRKNKSFAFRASSTEELGSEPTSVSFQN